VVVLIPHFNVASLGDELVVLLGSEGGGALLVFTGKTVTVSAMSSGQGGRDGREGEYNERQCRLHCLRVYVFTRFGKRRMATVKGLLLASTA